MNTTGWSELKMLNELRRWLQANTSSKKSFVLKGIHNSLILVIEERLNQNSYSWVPTPPQSIKELLEEGGWIYQHQTQQDSLVGAGPGTHVFTINKKGG
jgi:hypothetical protein